MSRPTALLTLFAIALPPALARPSLPREGSSLSIAADGRPYSNGTDGGNLDAHDAGFWVFIAIFPALAVISVVTALIILACEGSGPTHKDEEGEAHEGDGNEPGHEAEDGGQTHVPVFLGSEIVTVPALETKKDAEVTVDITEACGARYSAAPSPAPPYQPAVH